nr:MAG TPA: hypothetical protein [Caudoviricetes sp.]
MRGGAIGRLSREKSCGRRRGEGPKGPALPEAGRRRAAPAAPGAAMQR